MASPPSRWRRIRLAAVAALLATAILAASTPAALVPHGDPCSGTFELAGERLYLPATADATVTGYSHWPPGSDATVVLRFPDEPSTLQLRNDSVAVGERRWSARFDLTTVDEGRTFVAWLERDGRVVDAVAGEVGNATAALSFENQSVPAAEGVTVRRVHLDLGGFVAIRRDEPDGPVIAISPYLEPGTHEHVTFRWMGTPTATSSTRVFAVAHLDSNCNQLWDWHGSFTSDDEYVEPEPPHKEVMDGATVQFPTHTPTPTPRPSPSPTATPTPSATPSPTGMATPTPTTADTTTTGPGFGVGAALIAALGGVVLLWRQR